MNRLFFQTSGVFLIAAACVSQSNAQANPHWKQIGRFQAAYGQPVGTSGYFWSPTHGLVGTAGGFPLGANGPFIYYTIDGVNWQQSVSPAQPGITYRISDIYMKDTLNGWASLLSSAAGTQVLWNTTDGGVTWNPVPGYVSGGKEPQAGGLNSFDATTGICDIALAPANGFFHPGENNFHSRMSMRLRLPGKTRPSV
jgi:hypothetical protein